MDKTTAITAYHIVTAIKHLKRVRNILNTVFDNTDNVDITISSKALEETDFFTTDDKNIIGDIRCGIEIRISDLEKQLESL